MLIEVQYHDESGSVCPFCGHGVGVCRYQEKEQYVHEGYGIRLYPCVCSSGHLSFVAMETEEGDEFQYSARMFVYYQDWEDHIDMTITAGAYEMDCLDDEDDAWVIHRKMEGETNGCKSTEDRP